MSKRVIENDKLFDLLPYFAIMGEKLQKEIQASVKKNGNSNFYIATTILKNIKKIKKEVYELVGEVTDKTPEEVGKMNVIVTYTVFKEILSNKGISGAVSDIINFTVQPSSTGMKD